MTSSCLTDLLGRAAAFVRHKAKNIKIDLTCKKTRVSLMTAVALSLAYFASPVFFPFKADANMTTSKAENSGEASASASDVAQLRMEIAILAKSLEGLTAIVSKLSSKDTSLDESNESAQQNDKNILKCKLNTITYGLSEPFLNSKPLFRLSKGSAVLLLQRKGGWYLVSGPLGKNGWISSSSAEIIQDP